MASNDYYNTNNTYGDDGGDPDFTAAASRAQSEHSSTSPDLFSSAVSFLKENKDKFVGGGGDFSSGSSSGGPHVDEEEMVRAHQRMYGGGGEGQGDGDGDTRSMGMGAAMQALKMFNSGGSSGGGGGHSSGSSNGGGAAGGPDLNSLIGLAMGQAGKLFDEKQGSGVVSLLPRFSFLLICFRSY